MNSISTDDLDINITCSLSEQPLEETITDDDERERILIEIADGNDWAWCDPCVEVIYYEHAVITNESGHSFSDAVDFYYSELYKRMFVRAVAQLQLQLNDVQIHIVIQNENLFENWSTRHLVCMTRILEHTNQEGLIDRLSSIPLNHTYAGLIHEFWEIQETLCDALSNVEDDTSATN